MTKQRRKTSRRAQLRAVDRRPRECLFCGGVGKLTEQHVYDDWLRRLIFDGEGLREYISEPEPPVFQRGGPFTKTLRIVCHPCNEVWLSGIEKDAQTFLLRMFAANGQVELDSDAQLTLARWAFKIICVLSQTGSRKTFPLAHCREFHQSNRPPSGSQIWIGAASIRTASGLSQLAESQCRPWIANLNSSGHTVDVPLYSSWFRLLNVVFYAVGRGPPELGLRADLSEDLRRALLPIWPSEHSTIWWPPVTSLDAVGGVKALAATRLVGVPTVIPPTESFLLG